MNNRYLWFALGIGAALGSAAALLFAPQTGAKTRKQLGRALDDATDRAVTYAGEAGDYLAEQATKISAEAGKTLRAAGEQAGDYANAAIERGAAQAKAVTSMF